MNNRLPSYPRILSIAPTTSGFGFALMEGLNTLADWGDKRIRKDKNAGCVAAVERMIRIYEPQVLVLEDSADKEIHRFPRIQLLTNEIAQSGRKYKLKVAVLRRKQVRQIFFRDRIGTKHEVAEILARWYPEELARRLPPIRRPWNKEDNRLSIFDAVALALAFRPKK